MLSRSIALAALLLAACSTTTLTSSWRDEGYTGPALHKLLVIGVSENPTGRRIFEDEFVARAAERGAEVSAAYRMFPGEERLTRKQVEDGIAGQGFDGVAVVTAKGRRVEVAYVPETVEVRQVGGWHGHYSRNWEGTRSGGQATEYEVVTLEANMYHVESGALVWTGTFDTELDSSINEAIRSFVGSVISSLRDARLLD